MRESVSRSEAPSGLGRRLLTRGLIVLGGAAAGTALAWVVSGLSGGSTAAAETMPSPQVPVVSHIENSMGAANGNGAVHGATHGAIQRTVPRDVDHSNATAPAARASTNVAAGNHSLRQGIERAGSRLGDGLRDGARRDLDSATRAVGKPIERAAGAVTDVVHGVVHVVRDPRSSAVDAAEAAEDAWHQGVASMRAGWHRLTERGQALTPLPGFRGIGDVPVAKNPVTTIVGSSQAPKGRIGTGAGSEAGDSGPAAVAKAVQSPADATTGYDHLAHYGTGYAVDQSTDRSADRGHDGMPRAPAPSPGEPSAVLSVNSGASQNGSGSGNGAVAVTPAYSTAPDAPGIGRNGGRRCSAIDEGPGNRPGCTPD